MDIFVNNTETKYALESTFSPTEKERKERKEGK
jgi:hypothetical protein